MIYRSGSSVSWVHQKPTANQFLFVSINESPDQVYDNELSVNKLIANEITANKLMPLN